MPVQTAHALLLSVGTTAEQICHNVYRRAVGIFYTLKIIRKRLIAFGVCLLADGRQGQRRIIILVLNIVRIILGVRNGRAKVIGEPLKVGQPKTTLILTWKGDDAEAI